MLRLTWLALFRLWADSLSDFLLFFFAEIDSCPLSSSEWELFSDSELELEDELLESDATPDDCSILIRSAKRARLGSCCFNARNHLWENLRRPGIKHWINILFCPKNLPSVWFFSRNCVQFFPWIHMYETIMSCIQRMPFYFILQLFPQTFLIAVIYHFYSWSAYFEYKY